MIVSMWMTRDLVTIGPAASVGEAADLMRRHGIRRLPVISADGPGGRFAGIVSARELLHVFPSDVNPFAVGAALVPGPPVQVGRVMRQDVPGVAPELPIEEAAAIMRDRKLGELPVLRDTRLVGLITESDIFRAFVDIFRVSGHGARITFDIPQGEDIFALIGPMARRHGVRIVSLISAHEHERPVCVLRVSGDRVDRLLDDIWASRHRVLNVLRFPAAA